jgi:hypothetical protein
MVLYASNLLGDPVPVSKPKKGKKIVAAPEATPPPSSVEGEVVKEKKPRTEKQIAALEKMKAAREAKKAAKLLEESEKLRLEAEVVEREEEILLKKEQKKLAAAEKRKLKKMEKNVDVAVDEAVAHVKQQEVKPPPTKKKRVSKKVDPPEWFEQYIKGVKTEHNSVMPEPKPKEDVEKESVQEAKTHWNNSFTRARVTNEVDNHMDKMYQMMFGRKL